MCSTGRLMAAQNAASRPAPAAVRAQLAEATPAAPTGVAAGSPEEGRPIKAIQIEGNQLVSEDSIRQTLKTKVGEPYSDKQVEEDVQALYRTGKFISAHASRQPSGDEVIVTFHVTEKPEVESVEFIGNKKFKVKDLSGDVELAPGSPLDRFAVNRGRENIERRYKDAGYYYAKVTVDEDALKNERRVVYTIVEGPRVRVRKIVFEGNNSYPARRLMREVKTKTYIWIFRTGEFDQERAERDCADLRNFYRNDGYLDAQVSYRLETSEDRRDLTLIFVIDEGIRYHVESIKVEGNTVFDSDAVLVPLKIQPGSPYVNDWMKNDTKYVETEYGRIGYIDAKCTPEWVYADTKGLIKVTLKVHEGGQYRVGRIVIRGNERTQDKVVRRELRFYPEELYDTSKTKAAEQRLMETRLFNEATITPVGEGEGVRDALVKVQETETTTFLIGVGVTSNDGVVGSLSIENRNFDIADWPRNSDEFFRGKAFKGAGQIMRLQVEPGTELTRLRLDFREPYLFDQPISFGWGFYLFSRGRDAYTEQRIGTQISFGRRFEKGLLRGWAGEVAFRVEGVNIDDVDWDAAQEIRAMAGDHLLTSIKGTLVRDTTDSRFMPTQGNRFTVSWEQVGAMGGDYSFGKLLVTDAWHKTLRTDVLDRKSVLTLHGRVGQIFGDAPVFERFFGGGIGSVRGFEFRGISPRAGIHDDRVGGDFMFVTGAEYNFPVYGNNLRGVAFTDMGTVESDFGITSWRIAVGLGARVVIKWFGPVPMAFDFSVPVTKDDDDDTQVFQFSFGTTF
jgi:outer membrane protein insertion porin family